MKAQSQSSKLALYGGRPVREKLLPYGKQSIDESDIQSVVSALRSDFLTRGPMVKAFEDSLAELAGMPYAVAYHSATAALHAVMAMLGVKPGEKVFVPAITFAATSNSVLYCGGSVEFVDVQSSTLNIDPSKIPCHTKARVLAAVDFAGNPCEYDLLSSIARNLKIPLVADAAHSIGGSLNGKAVGALADVSIYSFHPVKTMTSGEGGCVLVRDAAQAEFLRQFKNHGLSGEERPGYNPQKFLGFNYHMTELQAALGLSQLRRLKTFVDRRNALARFYTERLKTSEYFEVPSLTEGARSAWHLYPLRLNLEKLSVDRDEFLKALRAENIGAQVHYMPVYFHPYYQSLGFKPGLCPVAEREYVREISIPLYPDMTDRDAEDVILGLEKLVEAFKPA